MSHPQDETTVLSEQRPLPVTAAIYDHGAERLFEAIVATCDPRAEFAVRVEAGLRASLALFAADPGLARTLTVRAELGEEAFRRRQYWLERYAVLLSGAASTLDNPFNPSKFDFMEMTLLGGIALPIAQQVLAGEAEDLEKQLPGLLEFILVFYVGPDEAARFVRAASG